jgi:hypothetical protein
LPVKGVYGREQRSTARSVQSALRGHPCRACRFVTKPAAESAPGTARRLNPSGYPGSQDGFSERMRPEATAHLGRPGRSSSSRRANLPSCLRASTPICAAREP